MFYFNFSPEFANKYKSNIEMENVVEKSNEVLSSFFKDESNQREREILYETVYGFKKVLADEYGLSMDNVYSNLSHLHSIKDMSQNDLNANNGEGTLGYFNARENYNTSETKCAVIVCSSDGHDTEDKYRETLTHELVHAMSQEYIENSRGGVYDFGACGLREGRENRYLNEVMTQKITMDILEHNGYEVEEYEDFKKIKDGYATELGIVSRGTGYTNISQTGELFHELYKKEIYSQMFDHNDALNNKLSAIYGNDAADFKFKLNESLSNAFNHSNSSNYIELYRNLADTVFTKVQSDNLHLAEYLNISGNSNSAYGCGIVINDTPYKLTDTISQVKEIEHFYGGFNKKFNSDFDLDKEANPSTRSKDCTNFVIVMSALKDMNLEYEKDKIDNLSYKTIKRSSDSIDLIYKYDDEPYYVSAKKDLKTGLFSLSDNVKVLDESTIQKPNFFEKFSFRAEKSVSDDTFEHILKMAKITDYSEYMVANSSDKEKVLVHAFAMKDTDVVEDTLNAIGKDSFKIRDSNNNNIAHLLAMSDLGGDTNRITYELCKIDEKELSKLFNMNNDKHFTPIDTAMLNVNFDMLNRACQEGIKIDDAFKYDKYFVNSVPMLISLQQESHSHLVEGLIKGGINIHIRDADGNTLLHHLAKEDNLFSDNAGTLNALREQKVNPNVVNNHNITPLMEMCRTHFPMGVTVDYLCEGLGANVNFVNSENRAAIHYFLNNNTSHELKEKSTLGDLINYGADVNLAGKAFTKDELVTPLQIASCCEHYHNQNAGVSIDYLSITKLIKSGADINESFGEIFSPLEMAQKRNDADMFKSFIDGGVKVDDLELGSGNLSFGTKYEILDHAAKKEALDKNEEYEMNSIEIRTKIDNLEMGM